jgi:hypothetical protein
MILDASFGVNSGSSTEFKMLKSPVLKLQFFKQFFYHNAELQNLKTAYLKNCNCFYWEISDLTAGRLYRSSS